MRVFQSETDDFLKESFVHQHHKSKVMVVISLMKAKENGDNCCGKLPHPQYRFWTKPINMDL